MQLQEKKYSVKSFESIRKIVKEKNLPQVKKVTSTHYYGQHSGNDVEKFVEYPDRVEVHAWKEIDGKFTPTESFMVKDKNEGIAWLKKKGFKTANVVKIDYVEYGYKKGVIGLYTIDDFHRSIILSYPSGKHELIEKELGLEYSEAITIPYNKLLEKMGKLRSMNLN